MGHASGAGSGSGSGSGSGAGGFDSAPGSSSAKSGEGGAKSAEKGVESREKQSSKQPEHLGKAQTESIEGRKSDLSEQIKQQRNERNERLKPDGKPGDATRQQGGRPELCDGDKVLVPGYKGTNVEKSADGHVNKIEYKDGTSREFKYARNGEVSEYKARDGSQWQSKDSIHWQNSKGGESMTGVMRVDSDGTFKFLNAGDAKYPPHLSMTKPDGSTVEDTGKELSKALKDLSSEGLKAFDKDQNGKVGRVEIAKAIVDPNITGGKALAAALLFNSNEAIKRDVSPADLNTDKFSHLADNNFGKLLHLGSRTELKPENSASVPNNDAVQGNFGDCRFITTMVSKSATQEGKQAVLDMVEKDRDGGYNVTFANQQKVHVGELSAGEKMLGARSKSDMLYPAVLEKAYGQVRNEDWFQGKEQISAKASERGDRDTRASEYITGSNDVEKISTHRTRQGEAGSMVGEFVNPNGALNDLDKSLTQAMHEHRVVTASIYNNALPEGAEGLRAQHEYSLLGYKDQKVFLRDPHGELPEKYNPAVIHPLDNGRNGEFWIDISNFNNSFNDVLITKEKTHS